MNRRNPRLLLLAPLVLAAVGLVIHVAWVAGVGGPSIDTAVNDWIYNAVLAVAALSCFARVCLVAEDRWAWLAFGLGLASWTAGDLYSTHAISDLRDAPYPSLADGGHLATYPCFIIGIGLLLRPRVAHFTVSAWLDGAIGALASAALGTAALAPALIGITGGDTGAVMTNLAYPVGDLLLVAMVVAAVIIGGGAGARWVLIGAGLLLWGLAEGIYLLQEADSSYTEGTILDSMWLAGGLSIASAAAVQAERDPEGPRHSSVVLPILFASIGVGLLVVDHFERLTELPVALAGATLISVILRLLVSFRENGRLLGVVQEEAVTDALTGLGNRRKVIADLDRLLARGAHSDGDSLFALFDLDGFKAYNDTFGHPAGDLLLRRLGSHLAASVSPWGAAYRLGGDEFCVVTPLNGRSRASIAAAAKAALSEDGEGFSITASGGTVVIPAETNRSEEALRIADHRMYAEKGRRSSSAERQTRDVLVRILQEREPALSKHLHGVGRLSVAMGRELGLEAEELDVVARAAELHDIGKIAIPDEILHKPGSLDELEWELMRSHPLIGERILGAAPAMRPVAQLVRFSHERWDGAGYPDGLSGPQIPLGSRMIFICDAYDAMTADRPYRRARPKDEAISELRANAGTQFDPELVPIFCRALEVLERDGPRAIAPEARRSS